MDCSIPALNCLMSEPPEVSEVGGRVNHLSKHLQSPRRYITGTSDDICCVAGVPPYAQAKLLL